MMMMQRLAIVAISAAPPLPGRRSAFAVLFDPVGVQVAEAIDFSAADKTEIDPSGLQEKHDVVETRRTRARRQY